MPAYNPSFRVISFREWVEKIDGEDRHRDSLYPYVYEFGTRKFRDTGPASGIYEGD